MKQDTINEIVSMIEKGVIIDKETFERVITKTKKQHNAKYYAEKGHMTHKQKIECPSCHKQVTKYYLKTHLKSKKCQNSITPQQDEE